MAAQQALPPWEPPWAQAFAPPPEDAPETPHDDDYVDEYAFAEDNPGWDAGELLRTFYAPGIGDMRVYARLDPNEMDIDPGQVLGPDNLEPDGPEPEKRPKSPK